MEETTAYAEFTIYGDEPNPEMEERLLRLGEPPKKTTGIVDTRKLIDLNEITSLLSIEPTETKLKGDMSKYGYPYIYTSWRVITKEEVSYDINDQLNQLINRLEDKVDILCKIKDQFMVGFSFCIVFYARQQEIPAIYFSEEVVQFIGKIGAHIEVDSYSC